MSFIFLNNWTDNLQLDLASGATTARISTAKATVLAAKNPSASNPIQVTLINGADIEIASCTAADGGTGDITLVRQQEGTTSPTSFAAGTSIGARITAAILEEVQTPVHADLPFSDLGTKSGAFNLFTDDSAAFMFTMAGTTVITLYSLQVSGAYRKLIFHVTTSFGFASTLRFDDNIGITWKYVSKDNDDWPETNIDMNPDEIWLVNVDIFDGNAFVSTRYAPLTNP